MGEDITYIKPRQPAPRPPQNSLILAPRRTPLHPIQRPHPILDLDIPEILLLVMQSRRNIMAHQRKETRYGKRFVAVAQHFKVDGVLVVDVGEEGDGCVDGDHEEDADDAGVEIRC